MTIGQAWRVDDQRPLILPGRRQCALDAKHAAAFLRREQIAFDEVTPDGSGSMQRANDAALAAVLQLSCYR